MENIIIQSVTLAIMVGSFLLGKYVFPNIPARVTDKLDDLAAWAAKFVVWAREFMKTSTGKEKMEKVVEQLKAIADEAGLNVTEEQLKAIAQAAYEAMKAGEAESEKAAAVAQGSTVIINAAPQAEPVKVAGPADQTEGHQAEGHPAEETTWGMEGVL